MPNEFLGGIGDKLKIIYLIFQYIQELRYCTSKGVECSYDSGEGGGTRTSIKATLHFLMA